MSAITDVLPTETLHEVVTSLDSPTDVLSLALSNSRFAEIAIPRHLIFRVLRLRISRSASIWRFMSRPDNLSAPEVRELDILPENIDDVCHGDYGPDRWMAEPLLPSELLDEEQIEHYNSPPTFEETKALEMDFIAAVQDMKNLRRFGWYRAPQPVIADKEDLWSAIGGLGSLEELDVVDEPFSRDTPLTSEYKDVKPLTSVETFLGIRGLITLTIHTRSLNPETGEADLTRLSEMLTGNTILENLSIQIIQTSWSTVSISSLLQSAHWNRLRTFDFSGAVNCTPSALLAFLQAHPLLEELGLAPLMVGKRWAQKPETPPTEPLLPRLKSLNCKSFQLVWLVEHGVGAGVTDIEGVDLVETVVWSEVFFHDSEEQDEADDEVTLDDYTGQSVPSPWREPLLDILRSNRLPSLSKVTLGRVSPAHAKSLAEAAPNLRELTLWPWSGKLRNYLPILASFPRLAVLSAPPFFKGNRFHLYKYPNYAYEENREYAAEISQACPMLERIVFEATQMVLVRDGTKFTCVFRKAGDNEAVIREGDIFQYPNVDFE